MALAERPFRIVVGSRDDALRDELDEARKNHAFLDSRHADFLTQYSGQWVAVYQERVVATAPDLEAMTQRLVELQIPSRNVALEFFDPEDLAQVL